MRREFSLIILAWFLMSQSIFAMQERSVIRGKVTDPEGNPLPGASVSVPGTFLGAVTGADGTYVIEGLKEGIHKVRFSFVGYKSVESVVELRGETEADAFLEPDAMMTGEVIVNAVRAGSRTPVTFTNVSTDDLRKNSSGHDMPFLLSLTPSLVETSEAGTGIGYTSMRIRGTGGNRINVTLDGIPLNDPESQQVFWVDLPDLSSSVDNIQVQRGVGTSANGAAAFGASVNIMTKIIEDEAFAEADLSAGSFNTMKTMASAGTGLLADRFALQMRYSSLKSDGYIERTGSDHRSAFISGIYKTARSGLRANIILGEEKTGIGWWGVPLEMLEINRRYNPAGEYTDDEGRVKYYDNETDNYTQNHYHLIFSHKAGNELSFQSALHYTKGKGYYEEFREDRSYTDYGLLPVSLNGIAINSTDMIRRKWMSNDFTGIVWSVSYRKAGFEGVAGGGASHYSGDHFGRIIWMRYSGDYEKDHQWYLNNGTKKEVSAYTRATWYISDRTNIFGDLQYRHINYLLDGFDDDLRDLGQKHKFNFVNPKAGIFISLKRNQDIYYSFSIAGREPTRTDFKEAAGDVSAIPSSETLFDHEAGYRMRTEKSSLTLNYYYMFYRDQLIPTGELSNVGYPIMTNVGKSYRTGIEISGGLKPFQLLEWRFNLTLSRNKLIDFVEYYTDYNTTDWSSEYKSKNLGTVDIAYSPSITGSSEIAFNPGAGLRVHFISKYVGRQYFDNTMSRDRMLSPYLINNLRIDFEPGIKAVRNTVVQLLVNNIFNSEYESNAYGGNWYEDGVEKTWAYYFPQAGINYMVRLNIKF